MAVVGRVAVDDPLRDACLETDLMLAHLRDVRRRPGVTVGEIACALRGAASALSCAATLATAAENAAHNSKT